MNKICLCISIIITLCFTRLNATHNRAGEITYRHIEGYTYEFTITTYTYAKSNANRTELVIEWGDNTSAVAPIVDGYPVHLPNDYLYNKYIAVHTFSGPGVFIVLVQDPNRNMGIKNIENSVNVVFSIQTTFIINPIIGYNNSPVMLNPPTDNAALGHLFIHNPAAYDPDGDSLSYKLSVCTEQNGKPISNYTLPPASDTLYINPFTGDLIWNTPVEIGKYNIAINIEEWRNGIKIGNVVRDMQIEVFDSDNNPPENPSIDDICVEAKDTIQFNITSVDPDGDLVNQKMYGGPFEVPVHPAKFTKISFGSGTSTSTFRWETDFSHVRRLPYQIVLVSEDSLTSISLTTISNFNITVIAPAPTGLEALPGSSEVNISWNASQCTQASGYALYRRQGSYDYHPEECENGVPEYTGFVKIGEVTGYNTTSFIDGLGDEGLQQGIEYCYIVTALFPDEAESYASESVCTNLIPGIPALTNVSVTAIDETNGEIFIAWLRPGSLDTIPGVGPDYVYYIYRSTTPDDANFQLIDSIKTSDLNDTTYYDNPLNTIEYPYYYRVKLFNDMPGNKFELGAGYTETASSLYQEIIPNDNKLTIHFKKKVPWVNTEYVVYRMNKNTLNYDSISTTTHSFYVDSLLENGVEQCYQIKSYGWRPVGNTTIENENVSHIACETPQDATPPCPPGLNVISNCDSIYNKLEWTNPNHFCSNDVIRYNIYYSTTMDGSLDSIASNPHADDTVYLHYLPVNVQLAGCYAVTAIDSFNNESAFSEKICIDECFLFQVPNVFTPNGDDVNDILYSFNRNNAVKKIDIKIFNRWGNMVYQTENPDIAWDGKSMDTKKIVVSGVYYYLCDVYQPSLIGTFVSNISGFIHVYTSPGKEPVPIEE